MSDHHLYLLELSADNWEEGFCVCNLDPSYKAGLDQCFELTTRELMSSHCATDTGNYNTWAATCNLLLGQRVNLK